MYVPGCSALYIIAGVFPPSEERFRCNDLLRGDVRDSSSIRSMIGLSTVVMVIRQKESKQFICFMDGLSRRIES